MTTPHELSELELELRAANTSGAPDEMKLSEKERARIDDLRRQNADFRTARDASAFHRAVQQRLESSSADAAETSKWQGFLKPRWAGPIFAMACAALIWVQAETPPMHALPETGIRSKGDVRLGLRVSKFEGTQVRSLASGDIIQPGDVIQLQVAGAIQQKKMVIFSIDGRGALTLHYPKGAGEPLAADGSLPHSFELDDAPAYERFFLVSGVGLQVDEVLEAARKMAKRADADRTSLEFPAHFPPDVAQSTFLLRKEVP